MTTASPASYTRINKELLQKAYQLMCLTKAIDQLYEDEKKITGNYLHSTSRGHEAIQIAAALQLQSFDYVAHYYRDEALLLGLGVPVEELMAGLLAKKTEHSSGKNYYLQGPFAPINIPNLIFTGSSSNMHLIAATGAAQGLLHNIERVPAGQNNVIPLVFCSFGDGALSNGEASEAIQMAVIKKLPIVFMAQDNDWYGSVPAEEIRAFDAYDFAGGFKGLRRIRVNGADFVQAFESITGAFDHVRKNHEPVFLHVKCPLLSHHSSALKKDDYRSKENLELHSKDEPIARLKKYLIIEGETEEDIENISKEIFEIAKMAFQKATSIAQYSENEIEKIAIQTEKISKGEEKENTKSGNKVTMLQAALKAIGYILDENKNTIYFGEDLKFSNFLSAEIKNLILKFGDKRVYNTPSLPSYLLGCITGLSQTGLKPIIQIKSDEALLEGLGQLTNVVSKINYLSEGKITLPAIIRVPVGAHIGGGSSQHAGIETILLQLKGINVIYPSCASDVYGLMNSALNEALPTIFLEHRDLYRIEETTSIEPEDNYIIPFGKSKIIQSASEEKLSEGYTCTIITYGIGVYLAKIASKHFEGSVEILDLRSLAPLDFEGVIASVRRHNKALILTEESMRNSFAESLAGRISKECFKFLDAPVHVLGSIDSPAIPLNKQLASKILTDSGKVVDILKKLLNY